MVKALNIVDARLLDGRKLDGRDITIPICGDDADAKRDVMALAEQIRGVRAVDGGPLASPRSVEGTTALLAAVNRRYQARAGVRSVGVSWPPRCASSASRA